MKMKATNQIIQILKDSNVQINYTNHQIKPSTLHPPLHFTPLLNTTIFQNQEIKGCILGHLLDFVFRDVHLTMAYCLDFLVGISLFGKNWNLFTATKIWASMTKIGRSMG